MDGRNARTPCPAGRTIGPCGGDNAWRAWRDEIFSRVRIEPERVRRLIWGVWQCSTIAWIGLAVLLFVTPWLGSDPARRWIIAVSIVTFGFAAAGNAWATRGRHFGWIAMVIVIGLAATGL